MGRSSGRRSKNKWFLRRRTFISVDILVREEVLQDQVVHQAEAPITLVLLIEEAVALAHHLTQSLILDIFHLLEPILLTDQTIINTQMVEAIPMQDVQKL